MLHIIPLFVRSLFHRPASLLSDQLRAVKPCVMHIVCELVVHLLAEHRADFAGLASALLYPMIMRWERDDILGEQQALTRAPAVGTRRATVFACSCWQPRCQLLSAARLPAKYSDVCGFFLCMRQTGVLFARRDQFRCHCCGVSLWRLDFSLCNLCCFPFACGCHVQARRADCQHASGQVRRECYGVRGAPTFVCWRRIQFGTRGRRCQARRGVCVCTAGWVFVCACLPSNGQCAPAMTSCCVLLFQSQLVESPGLEKEGETASRSAPLSVLVPLADHYWPVARRRAGGVVY